MKGVLKFCFHNIPEAKDFKEAICPERYDIPGVNAKVFRKGKDVIIEIDAEDTSSLRAGLKSYLQWCSCIIEMQKIAKGVI